MSLNSVDAGIRRRMFLSREAARLTQKDAAEEIGMSRQKLSRCESGESSPTPEELKAMCILYGVTPSYVLFGDSRLAPAITRAMRGIKAADSPEASERP